VNTIVDVIGGGINTRGASNFVFGIGLLRRVRRWIQGDRISVGAGAGTYSFASNLPSVLLDALINLPHFLISVRNALLPVPPPPTPPPQSIPLRKLSSTVVSRPHPLSQTLVQRPAPTHHDPPITFDHEEQVDSTSPETGSEADVESNAGDISGVESSWVSLRETGSESPIHV